MVGPPPRDHRRTAGRERPWHLEARCRDTDPDLFFPVGTTGVDEDNIRAAKDVCAGCPVSKACLEEALRNNDYGIWGGTDEEERRVIRRRRALERKRTSWGSS